MKVKHIILSISCLLFAFSGYPQVNKEDVMVLFVGFDPQMPMPVGIENSTAINGGMSPERFGEDYQTRFPAFEDYLKSYFTEVETVDARDYKVEMSDNYDVTIFDQVIKPWKEEVRETGKDGKMHYEPARYLTEEFDHATIFIGHTAPVMGRSIGLKLDWLCLCLDADAHHIKAEHAIFKGPFKVNLTMTEKPTPDGIYHYYSGQDIPRQIPMWWVQKEGYLERLGYRVGMVARGGGFLDSPDTEYISSGVNTKDVGAVAIGRHANFFMWGFSASPDYMTDEAKQVFANTVVYMKQFNGKKPVARKYNEGIATREEVEQMVYSASEEAYKHHVQYLEKNNAQRDKFIEKLKKKKESGDQLTDMENSILEMQSAPTPLPDWKQYLKQVTGVFYKEEYVDNIAAFKNFIAENKAYMYSEPDAFHTLKIDTDAKELGVSNRDIKILYKAVELLRKGEQTAMAKRILDRYTNKDFPDPETWEDWLNTNKNNLFFTEAGGYVWLVNKK